MHSANFFLSMDCPIHRQQMQPMMQRPMTPPMQPGQGQGYPSQGQPMQPMQPMPPRREKKPKSSSFHSLLAGCCGREQQYVLGYKMLAFPQKKTVIQGNVRNRFA